MSKPNRGHKPQGLKRVEQCAVEQAQPKTPIYGAFEELNRQAGILESLFQRLEERLTPILHPMLIGQGGDPEEVRQARSPIVGCIDEYAARVAALNERLENLLPRIEC